MIAGEFRDGHPRATLQIHTSEGPLEIEFIIDTGFEGDLVIPDDIARRLGGPPNGFIERMLADGSVFRCPTYLVEVDTGESRRTVEAIVMGRNSLLGTVFLLDHLLQVEVSEGGAVSAELL